MQIYFGCEENNSKFCIIPTTQTLFNFKTKIPSVWMHLMFLQVKIYFDTFLLFT